MVSLTRIGCIQWNPGHYWARRKIPDLGGVGLKSTQTWYLGRKKVSWCPYFRGVLIEGFHCIHVHHSTGTHHGFFEPPVCTCYTCMLLSPLELINIAQ